MDVTGSPTGIQQPRQLPVAQRTPQLGCDGIALGGLDPGIREMGGQGRNALSAMIDTGGMPIQSPTIFPNTDDAVERRTAEDDRFSLPRFPRDLFAPHLNT